MTEPLAEAISVRENASARWQSRIVVGASGLVIAFALAQILTFGYGRDQGIYAVVGKAVLEGKMPYRDAWDFKPPGIFLVYAFARAVFGSSEAGIRALEVIGLAAMVAGMIKLAERVWGDGEIGWIAGAVATLVHAQLDFWHTAQPESFGGMVTIAGLLVASRGKRGDAYFSGALFGFAGLLKPPLAGGGAVVALWLAALAHTKNKDAERTPRLRATISPIVHVALGGATPILLCAAWFLARGALSDLKDVLFVFTPHYTALGWEGESLGGMVYWGFTEWLCAYSSIPTVGFLLLLGLGTKTHERPLVLVLLGVLGVHIAGVILQAKFFPYHYGATWPVTAMLAGLGFHKLWKQSMRAGSIGTALFLVFAVAVAFGRTATKDTADSFLERSRKRIRLLTARPRDQVAIDRLASVADVDAGQNRGVADLLRARTPAGAPIFVFGFEPVIYDLADRPPATRFIYDVPQRVPWAKSKLRETLMGDLARTPPAAIVVEHHDVFPMVTGDAIDSADVLRDDFPALRSLVAADFASPIRVGDFDVYLKP